MSFIDNDEERVTYQTIERLQAENEQLRAELSERGQMRQSATIASMQAFIMAYPEAKVETIAKWSVEQADALVAEFFRKGGKS